MKQPRPVLGGSSNPTAGVRPGMGGSGSAPSQPAPAGGNMPSDSQTANHSRLPITDETKGVIGISNLTLNDTASNASQGSVVTSEENNVKLECSTMMLLRVSQWFLDAFSRERCDGCFPFLSPPGYICA